MKRWLVLSILVLAVPGPLVRPARAANLPKTSDVCGECHKDIYRWWKSSMHARSMEDDIFLTAFRETQGAEGETVARVCLCCHAPLAEVDKDWKLQQKVTWEGVSCNVCHSLVSVELTSQGAKQVLDVGKVKRGPIQDAASSAHEVAYSELHTTSLICAGCHEFTDAEGVPLMTTYSEWAQSGAARDGKTCQSCHMGRTQADVVDPKMARVAHAEVNLHEVPGGHSLEQLHKALGVAVEPRHDGDSLAVEVRLTNKGAGHAVPTGMPGRKVMLELQVRASTGQTFEETRTYAKFFSDAQGQRIDRDSRYFARGVRLQSDTRIRPDEKRVEVFHFAVPPEATSYVTLKLHYEHAPTGGSEGRTRLTFMSESRVLEPRSASRR